MRPQLLELLRFLLVGGSAVGIDLFVYFGLVSWLQAARPSPAKAISFVCGAVVAFFLNRAFVFRATETGAGRQAVPFILLYLTSLALNTGVNALLLGFALPKLVAWFFATAASTVTNFIGMKFIVFRRREAQT